MLLSIIYSGFSEFRGRKNYLQMKRELLPRRDASLVINQPVSRTTALLALCVIGYLAAGKEAKFALSKNCNNKFDVDRITLKLDGR